jgi:hypothetical protein
VLTTFADIPAEIRRRVDAGARVALILLDAFGLRFLERHGDHPLVAALTVTPLQTQFPSTTTAHVTTIHFGLPVTEHGLYEWNVLEPSLGAIICPLRFNLAGSDVDGDLVGRLDPAVLVRGPTLYETLGVPSFVAEPIAISNSTYTRLATRGATVIGFAALDDGLAQLAGALTGLTGPGYGFLYWDAIDRAGHEHGPSSVAFEVASVAALDALWPRVRALRDSGVEVLITADHGQIDVKPEVVDYLDDAWPELPARLSQPRPAGSSRDAFLHVVPGALEEVIAELTQRLGERARVAAAAELLPHAGPRLRERLGDVIVLPAGNRQSWLRSASANERWFRGQHGGLTPVETGTYLAEVHG